MAPGRILAYHGGPVRHSYGSWHGLASRWQSTPVRLVHAADCLDEIGTWSLRTTPLTQLSANSGKESYRDVCSLTI